MDQSGYKPWAMANRSEHPPFHTEMHPQEPHGQINNNSVCHSCQSFFAIPQQGNKMKSGGKTLLRAG
jgi:hypothetical protein